MSFRLAGIRGSWLLLAVLSTTAGAVDVIGFLALHGLFTAHITGNLCVLAAHYITGAFGQVGQLLSVPVFIAVLGVVTLAFGRAEKVSDGSRRALLILQAALLAACLVRVADNEGDQVVLSAKLDLDAPAFRRVLDC